jgi:GT2 family glycosyltransferase
VVDNGSHNNSVEKIKEYALGKIKPNGKYITYINKNKPISVFDYTRTSIEDDSKNDDSRSISNFKIDPKLLQLKPTEKLIIIKNEENFGFAEGNNIGIRFALKHLKPDYFLLLNNDTSVEREFLTEMINAGESNNLIGVIGARIPYYDNPNKNWFCRGIINWFSINIAYHGEKCIGQTMNTDYITGCVALIKKQVIEKVGYLNNTLYLYFEDADYSLRVKQKGFKLLVVPEAKVYHKVSATSYTFILSTAQYYFSRNRIWFIKKYCPKKYQKLSMMFIFIRFFLATGFFTLKGEKDTVREIIRAYNDGLRGSY